MTTITADAPTTVRVNRGHAVGDALTMAWRNLLNLVRNPQLLVFATIQPVIFVLMFRYVFGGAIQGSLPPGQTYVNFLMPGIFVQTIVFGSLTTGVGLADDLSKGLIDRFRSLPMARSAVLVGRTLADLLRNFFVVHPDVHRRLHRRMDDRHQRVGPASARSRSSLAFSYSLSWVFAIVGLTVKDAETAQAVSFPILAPLVFASSAFVPVATMPSWLQGWAKNQPVSVVVNAARAAHHRRPDGARRHSRRSSGSSASSPCARRSPSPATAAPSDSVTNAASPDRRHTRRRLTQPWWCGVAVTLRGMSRDIAALVASMTVDEKAAFTAGADLWTLVANERVGIPPIRVTDGPNGARGSALFGLGGETAVCAPCGSALGATWDPELVERVGRDARRGGAHQGLPRAAGADGQPPPIAARWSQLRVLLRGPAALGEDRGGVRARGAVAGRRHDGEALRGQRRRVRAPEHQLGDRRPDAARAHAGAVRARGARGWRARDHDGVQPPQRAALLRAPPAHHRDPARRVGVRRVRADRLDERGFHRRIVGGGPRPRDAGAGRVLREAPRRRGARRRRARGRARRARHAPAAGVRPHRRARRRSRLGEHVDRPARTPRARAGGRHRGDRAAARTRRSCRSTDRACARSRSWARTPNARR